MSKKVIVNGMNIGYLPPTNASEITFDNSGGGISSNNVQDVIEELEESLSDTQDQLFMPIMVSKSYKQTENINTIDLTIKAPMRYTAYQGFFYARYSMFSICIIIGGSSTIISCGLQKITNGGYDETITTTIDNSGTDKVITLQSNYDWNRFAISLWETDLKTNEELKNSFTLSNGRLIS